MSALIGSVISGALGLFGANKAAKAQERVGREQIALQREIYDETTGRLQPYAGAGENALSAYLYELGLGPRPTFGGNQQSIQEITTPGTQTYSQGDRVPYGFASQEDYLKGISLEDRRNMAEDASTVFRVGGRDFATRAEAEAFASQGGTPYEGISMSPAAQFALTQGRDTIEAGAAAGGGLYSGATMKGLEDYRFGLSQQDRDNQLNRLAGLMSSGQNAAASQGAAGQNFATGASNALANIGNAQAAGIVGGVNAINSGINNYLGYQQMNKLLQPQGGGGGGTNWFGGLW